MNNESKGEFKGKKSLVPGIYFLVSPSKTFLFDFLVGTDQNFSIIADTSNYSSLQFLGSFDNRINQKFAQLMSEISNERKSLNERFKVVNSKKDSLDILEEFNEIEYKVNQYKEKIIKQYPDSLISFLFIAMQRPVPPKVSIVKGKPDSLYPYRYVREHFWDGVLFSDDRLLRTPFFEPKLDDYFKYFVSPNPDSIYKELKFILYSAKGGKEIYPFLLTKFTNKYMNPEIMGQDKVFISLFENFYAKGDTILLNSSSRKLISEKAYNLIANQIGNPAPKLNLTDTIGKQISLQNISADFIMIVFWDPNCGHCKEEIPRLDSFYQKKWKKLGLIVYGINVNENEKTAWKKFIIDNKLIGWLHAYQTKYAINTENKAGIANYRQLYNVFKTPTLYLLDKEKRIIAKQLSLEQFDEILSIKSKK